MSSARSLQSVPDLRPKSGHIRALRPWQLLEWLWVCPLPGELFLFFFPDRREKKKEKTFLAKETAVA